MSAVARLAESVSVPTVLDPFNDVTKWFFGGATLLVLLLLVFLVSRFNLDR
jgi:phage-related holin